MKKPLLGVPVILLSLLFLVGLGTNGEKTTSLSIIYGVTAVCSFLLLVGCIVMVHKTKGWFLLLFSSVFVVNCGYTLLSVSKNLSAALWANRLSYLGSVFLPLSMLMILLNVTNTVYKKRVPLVLLGISAIIFLIAATPGVLPIYYKSVSFTIVNGASSLVKEYGPLHWLYLVYLVGYFAFMIGIIIRSQVKKSIDTTAHAIILASAVFVNIGVWLIEQLTSFDYEMLSISYIISELFLLGVSLVTNENQQLRDIVKKVETVQQYKEEKTTRSCDMLTHPIESHPFSPERLDFFVRGLKTLTPTEKTIYQAYVARVTTKEIMANLTIKESTLKYHNRNLYGKLGVSSRKELLELQKQVQAVSQKTAQ